MPPEVSQKEVDELLQGLGSQEKERIRKAWEKIKGKGIPWDLWAAAWASYSQHCLNPLLNNHTVFTLVDFRIADTKPRLWVVRHKDAYVLGPVRVAHGEGSGKGPIPQRFSNIDLSFMSSIGPFATHGNTGSTGAGFKKADKEAGRKNIMLRVHGLDSVLNGIAFGRRIYFHGAHYVTDSRVNVGNSRGCFATSWDNNRKIIALIKGGTFVFAYAGTREKTAATAPQRFCRTLENLIK